jgi:hypothetical protein
MDGMEGLESTNQVDVEVESVDKKEDEVVNLEVETYMFSLNDKVIHGTRGETRSDRNFQKFEQNDGHSHVDGGNGDMLEKKVIQIMAAQITVVNIIFYLD